VTSLLLMGLGNVNLWWRCSRGGKNRFTLLRLGMLQGPNTLRFGQMAVFRRPRRTIGVKLSGNLEDYVLPNAMVSAIALVCLSPADRYGLPIAESLSLGSQVICADTPINKSSREKFRGLVMVPVEDATVSISELVDIKDNSEPLAH